MGKPRPTSLVFSHVKVLLTLMVNIGSHFLSIYTILIENKLIYNLKIADFLVKAQQQYDDDYH